MTAASAGLRDDATAELVQALLRQAAPGTGDEAPQLLETHISWVLLTGSLAYKIKKPVRLSFLDFSTLDRRKAACEDELRLNRLLAPQLYLDVAPITGSREQPCLGGRGAALEYAVKMRRFPQSWTLDRRLQEGHLETMELQRFGEALAQLHQRAASAPAGSRFGEPAQVQAPLQDTLQELRAGAPPGSRAELEYVDTGMKAALAALTPLMAERKSSKHIRDCHGDLHLGNLVRLDEGIVPFDRIEFSDDLRWIDGISDVAFLVMDLDRRGQVDLAYAFLAAYLEAGGDYEGLRLLRYYEVYRALVRAKVAMIRGRASGDDSDTSAAAECSAYLQWAAHCIRGRRPGLVLMHGLAGSGKTRLSEKLIRHLPAVRVRSDLERKRMHAMQPLERGDAAPGAGLYSAAASLRLYERLTDIAQAALEGGETLIVDAAFLKAAERRRFFELAARLDAPCVIVHCTAPVAELERRVRHRAAEGRDASDAGIAVLHAQSGWQEALEPAEQACTLAVDTTRTATAAQLAETVHTLLNARAHS